VATTHGAWRVRLDLRPHDDGESAKIVLAGFDLNIRIYLISEFFRNDYVTGSGPGCPDLR